MPDTRSSLLSTVLGSLARRFELEETGSRRVRPMEGLRGIAVTLVFIVHYTSLIAPWIDRHSATAVIADGMQRLGNSGVDLFFVLSGFLIYGGLVARQQRFLPYLRRRVERIYPTFLVVFCVYLCLSLAFPHRSKVPLGSLPGGLYMMENLLLLPGLFHIEPMIAVAWSLSYEMFYYLVTPAVILILALRRWSAERRAWLLLTLAAAVIVLCGAEGGPVRLAMFLAGALLHEIGDRCSGLRAARLAPAAFALGIVAVGAVPGFNHWDGPRTLLLFGAYYGLCFACFSGIGVASTITSWTALRRFGNMSYSYYLLHGLVLNGFFAGLAVVHPPHGSATTLYWWLLLPAFAITIALSVPLFLLVEHPLSLVRKKRVAPVPASSLELTAYGPTPS